MFFFDVHTHEKSVLKNVFSIENKYPNNINFTKPFSIGIHPCFIKQKNVEKEFLIIEDKLKNKNCFAIGECGLDKISEVDFKLQKEVFKRQIELSEKYEKPLIIHCVKAHQDIIEIKKHMNPKQIWILHGFNKNLQIADSLVKNGIILSFGKAIIHNKKLEEVLSKISISSILLETDDSDYSIQEIYQKLSEIKQVSLKVLQKEIYQNFKNIFKI